MICIFISEKLVRRKSSKIFPLIRAIAVIKKPSSANSVNIFSLFVLGLTILIKNAYSSLFFLILLKMTFTLSIILDKIDFGLKIFKEYH